MEGHRRSYPNARCVNNVRKVTGGGGGWVVACRIIVSAPVPVPFLWTLDLGFWTWILNLDFGLDLGFSPSPSL